MKKRIRKTTRFFNVFTILYLIGFLGAGLIGLFANSFFAHTAFQSLWAKILYLLFISLLFLTAFAQEIKESRKKVDIIVNAMIFLGGLSLFILFQCVGGIFFLLGVLYSAVMLCVIVVRGALAVRFRFQSETDIETAPDTKQLIAVFSLLILGMVSLLSVKFVNDRLFAWALIPTSVLLVAALVTAFFLFRNTGVAPISKLRRLSYSLALIVCVFIVSYMYSWVATGIANCVFDDDPPTPTVCVVNKKKIQSGARTVTQFLIEVTLDGKKKWIEIPTEEYYALTEGDTVVINYYRGALRFAYYAYAGKQ